MIPSFKHAGAERRELRDQSAAPDSSDPQSTAPDSPDPSNKSPRTHLPGLDRLRGLAILMVMILHFSGGIARRIFAGRTLGFFGKYSYGLYVFHCALEPTFRHFFSVYLLIDRVFHHYWPPRFAYMTISMGISIAAAWASWHLYEKQFLKLKRFFESRPAREAQPAAPPAQVEFLKAA
ncbi:MAG: acyltransferase 3 [Phycisphaerales bacterium]|nr:acyltransferase 3 [Phycisphaerales bacterium]